MMIIIIIIIIHIVIPITMEFFNPICAEALTFLNELGRRMFVVTGETIFILQCLSIAIQLLNCILFKSSFIGGENELEFFYLNDLN